MFFGKSDATYLGAFAQNVQPFGTNPFTASWQDIVTGLSWGLGYFGMPHIIVRFMAIEKPSMVKKSATVAIVWVVLTLGAAIAMAVIGRTYLLPNGNSLAAALLPDGAQQNIFITIVQAMFPGFVAGLLLAAIIAAAMSTADSQLLVASSAFSSDLYKPIIRKNKASDKEMLWIGRLVVLAVAIVAFFIATAGIDDPNSWTNSIMSMVENAWGLFGAAFGPVVILSLFWKRLNYSGAVAGILAGAAMDIAWLLLFTNTIIPAVIAPTGIYEILPGFVAGMIVSVVVSLVTKAPSAEVEAIVSSALDTSVDN
jgi:sodium/proline symporter